MAAKYWPRFDQVEAVQYDGRGLDGTAKAIIALDGTEIKVYGPFGRTDEQGAVGLGWMETVVDNNLSYRSARIYRGDWVVRYPNGMLMVYSSEQFEALFEETKDVPSVKA